MGNKCCVLGNIGDVRGMNNCDKIYISTGYEDERNTCCIDCSLDHVLCGVLYLIEILVGLDGVV